MVLGAPWIPSRQHGSSGPFGMALEQGAVSASPLPGYWIWQHLTKFNLCSWQFHKGNHLRRGSTASVQSQSIRMLSSAKTPPVVGSAQEKTELLCDGQGEAPHSPWRRLPGWEPFLWAWPDGLTEPGLGRPSPAAASPAHRGRPMAASSPEVPGGQQEDGANPEFQRHCKLQSLVPSRGPQLFLRLAAPWTEEWK